MHWPLLYIYIIINFFDHKIVRQTDQVNITFESDKYLESQYVNIVWPPHNSICIVYVYYSDAYYHSPK